MHAQDSTGLPASEATALLTLAMNCSNRATADAAVDHLPAQLDEGTARQLLRTAAARQHVVPVLNMLHRQGMQQLLDEATIETVFSQLLWQEWIVQHLCLAPAAAQLSGEAAIRLLVEATKQRSDEAVVQLCAIAGAQQLSSRQMMALLEACLETCTEVDDEITSCLLAVCRLPAAAALSSDDVVQLIKAVIKHGPCDHSPGDARCDSLLLKVIVLRQLPSAADFSSSQMVQLLNVAVLHNSTLGISSLRNHSIAGGLNSEMLLEPLQQAVACGSGRCTSHLCEMPSAQQLSVEAVAQLLQVATDPLSVRFLSQLPAAAQLTSRQLLKVREMYVMQGSNDCILALRPLIEACGLPMGI